MRTLLLFACLIGSQAHAIVFTAAKNISEHLERQENRVGACTEVSVILTTLRALDGDHDFLGFEGVGSDGRRFAYLKEFGVDGSRPRVLRRSPGEYLVYISSVRTIGFGEHRETILTLRTDFEGKTITDLVAPDGRRLCADGLNIGKRQ